jgi:hypothetical protein
VPVAAREEEEQNVEEAKCGAAHQHGFTSLEIEV